MADIGFYRHARDEVDVWCLLSGVLGINAQLSFVVDLVGSRIGDGVSRNGLDGGRKERDFPLRVGGQGDLGSLTGPHSICRSA